MPTTTDAGSRPCAALPPTNLSARPGRKSPNASGSIRHTTCRDRTQANRDAQQARDTLANVRKELAETQAQRDRVVSERGQAEQALQTLSADRDAGTAALDDLRKRQTDAQGQLATLTETLATRNKEAAAIDERLASARQDLSTAQAKLAEIRQQIANPPAAAPSQPAR